MRTSRFLVVVFWAVLFAVAPVRRAHAQIDVLWQTPSPNNETTFVGAANMDADAADELVYYKPSSGTPGSILILDGGTAGIDYQGDFDGLVMSTTDPFCDVDGNGVSEITFWGYVNQGDPPRVFVVGNLGPVSSRDDPAVLEARPHLAQNYPNPFRPSTTIQFSVPSKSDVRLDVFNVNGRRVRTLLDEEHGAGAHSVTWDGTNDNGHSVASGTYFYQLVVGDQVFAKKAVVLK